MALYAIKHCDGYSFTETVEVVDDATVQKSREQFERYKRDGIITADTYDDMKWIITDEVCKGAVINFQLDEVHYVRTVAPKLGCSLREYIQTMKIIVTTRFGYSIKTIQSDIAALREFANEFIIPADYGRAHMLADFLLLLPGEMANREEVLRVIDDIPPALTKNGQQRTLAHYQTYLCFLDIMTRFWEEASAAERILYFPVWFWFCITGVLPLRPTECVLTPRQCISYHDMRYYLEVRRTRKKGFQQSVRYRMEYDYERYKYPLPDHLASHILEYIAATEETYESDIDVLFSKKAQFKEAGVSGEYDKHYTYNNLKQCLAYFYRNIIQDKYQYHLVKDVRNLNDAEIGMINLGDMRHIAMVSLAISGGNPSICKALAGHDSIEISAHYYDNLTSFLDVLGYERYREQKTDLGKAYGVAISQCFPVRNGFCQNENVCNGDYSPCASAVNCDGIPGSCEVCKWFFPSKQQEMNKERIASELQITCTLLRQAVEQIREGIGCSDTISSILDRLAAQSEQYIRLSARDWVNKESEETR